VSINLLNVTVFGGICATIEVILLLGSSKGREISLILLLFWHLVILGRRIDILDHNRLEMLLFFLVFDPFRNPLFNHNFLLLEVVLVNVKRLGATATIAACRADFAQCCWATEYDHGNDKHACPDPLAFLTVSLALLVSWVAW